MWSFHRGSLGGEWAVVVIAGIGIVRGVVATSSTMGERLGPRRVPLGRKPHRISGWQIARYRGELPSIIHGAARSRGPRRDVGGPKVFRKESNALVDADLFSLDGGRGGLYRWSQVHLAPEVFGELRQQ